MVHYFRNTLSRSTKQHFIFFFIIIFLCCTLGILTRPLSFLASFWPANSIFLGLLIRYPTLRNRYALTGGILGYLVSDSIFGSSLPEILVLTLANLCYIAVTFGLYHRFIRKLQGSYQGYFYLFLFSFCAIGSFAGALFASLFVPMVSPVFMHGNFWIELGGWFTAEMQNALLLLPILISLPFRNELKHFFQTPIEFQHLLPVMSVTAALVFCFYDNGPGSVLYPIAVLIWCALTYRHFSVTIITSISASLLLYHLTHNYIALYPQEYLENSISIRLGMIMMVIAPLTVSNINSIRSRLIEDLEYIASHDELTLSLTRRYFYQTARTLFTKILGNSTPSALLMLDIDHFKSVNDNYGHFIGDQAIKLCAHTIKSCLRPNDILGRLGGEEFAILLPQIGAHETFLLAECIRKKVSEHPIYLSNNHPIYIHVSIGISFFQPNHTASLEQMLKEADQALYRAKQHGRNTISSYS